jgi:cytidylate kinase
VVPPPKVRAEKAQFLADRQMRRWELQRRSAARPSSRSPCVALTRLPGAGGEEIAQRVAETLDYGLFGREIVDEIARELHVDHWLVADLDERVRGAIDRFVGDAMVEGRVTESEYLRRLTRTIATLGRRGGAVILGRGAAYLLPPDQALRVLVVAPRPERIERYAKVKGLGDKEAAEDFSRVEERRSEFARRHFGIRQDDPTLYDLVLNSASIGIETAAALVVDTLRRRFPS